MKAWLIDELAGIQALRLRDVPDPKPGPGEVLLDLLYAALNPADRYLAERQYPARPSLPHILGRDGIGVVAGVGEGVADVKIGEKCTIMRGETGVNKPGTFAERVVIPATDLAPVPAGWSDQEAAGASLVYLTAYQALTMWGPLPDNAVVLVTGASGGVGVASVQLAAAMGYTVVALSRSASKRTRLQQLGATVVIDPQDSVWRKELKKNIKGVDLAVDSVGGALLSEVIDVLGQSGRVSLVGRLAGTVPNFNTATLFFRRLKMGGVAVGTYTREESRQAWAEVQRFLAQASTRPLVDSVFAFDKLPDAFEKLAQGPMGKVLLAIKETST